jgi:autotransporter-associated beta strand protein
VVNWSTGTVNITGGEVSANTGYAVFLRQTASVIISVGATVTSANTTGGGGTIFVSDEGTPKLEIRAGTIRNTAGGNTIYNNNNTERVVFNISTTFYTFGGVIAGHGAIRKTNTGRLILTAKNTYTGHTGIEAGTLQVEGAGDIGSTSEVSIGRDATLRFDPGADMIFSKRIWGEGNVEYNGGENKRLFFTADNLYTGTTTVNGGDFHFGNDGETGSVAGNIVLNGGTLWLHRTNNFTYNGAISGTGNIGKTNGNTVTLGGASTFSGFIAIYSGTLALSAGGTIENANVNFGGANAKFDISAGSKKIKGLNSVGFPGEVVLGSSTLTIGTTGQNDGTGTFSGVFSGTGSVVKRGSGTLTINGANTATGNLLL